MTITSCTASTFHLSFTCEQVFDGILTGTDNGWANGAIIPSSITFSWDQSETIEKIEILSGIGRSNHMITNFEVTPDFRFWRISLI